MLLKWIVTGVYVSKTPPNCALAQPDFRSTSTFLDLPNIVRAPLKRGPTEHGAGKVLIEGNRPKDDLTEGSEPQDDPSNSAQPIETRSLTPDELATTEGRRIDLHPCISHAALVWGAGPAPLGPGPSFRLFGSWIWARTRAELSTSVSSTTRRAPLSCPSASRARSRRSTSTFLDLSIIVSLISLSDLYARGRRQPQTARARLSRPSRPVVARRCPSLICHPRELPSRAPLAATAPRPSANSAPRARAAWSRASWTSRSPSRRPRRCAPSS